MIFFIYYLGIIIMQNSAKAIGQKLLKDRSSVKAYISGNNSSFNEKITKIINKEYKHIKQVGIFQHKNNPNPHIFYFYASKYEADYREDVEEYIVKQLHHFHNNYECSYAVAYVHSSIFDFIAFRRFIEKWPEHFFYKLRRIYIVGASLMVKFIESISFGPFYRLCDQLFMNLSEENEIKQIDFALMAQLGQNTTTPAQNTYKNSIKIIQSAIYGKTLMQYDLFSGKYPIIILRLLARLVRNPQQLQFQGIFRKSCDSQQLQKLQKHIESKNWIMIDKQQDILVVCGCLKKILNNLKLPLFNYKIYDTIIAYNNNQNEVIFIKKILEQMEYVNHKLFILLLVFLTNYIIHQKDFNKMNGYNLSVVFGPCFFRPQQYDLNDLFNSGKFAKILVICFEKQNQIIQQSQRNLANGILKSLQQGTININSQ